MKNVKKEDRKTVLVSADTVGDRIKKARVARNVTQTELSKRVA
jgi:ribosome-binding protein aMBF1 (putative translation factor)